jgi:hypothetical protein
MAKGRIITRALMTLVGSMIITPSHAAATE